MKTLHKWSVEDYHRIVETGILNNCHVELIEGEIVAMSPEGPLHKFTNHELAKYLRSLLGKRAEVFEAHPITLDNSEPELDVAIVRSPASLYRDRHATSEDIYWLIEVSDTTLSDDLTRKKAIYARNNIQEYWVVDVANKKLWVFQNPEDDNYQNMRELTTGFISSSAFGDVSLEVHKLLAN